MKIIKWVVDTVNPQKYPTVNTKYIQLFQVKKKKKVMYDYSLSFLREHVEYQFSPLPVSLYQLEAH